MNIVFIVPTGIGAKIGGHAGDATPAFKLIASISDIAITHPNVVNASDINEMPENTWYVEGSILDQFLEGKVQLKKPKTNRILLVVNKPIQAETINAVNAARHTIGCEIEIVELEEELKIIGKFEDEKATGDVHGWEELTEQISSYNFDALAVASEIEVQRDIALSYLRNGGVNPWGGAEAKASKLIAERIGKPVAHAPIESNDPEMKYFNEVVNPRIAAEAISQCYIHCVFKGLHKAPRISDKGLSVEDIDCMVTPDNCFGRPHEACLKAGIPVVVIRENKTCANSPMPAGFIFVENYLEAAGVGSCIKAGITIKAIRQ